MVLRPHPLKGPSGEEGQHQSEGRHEQAGKAVDDAYLLKNDGGVVKGGQEIHMAIANR